MASIRKRGTAWEVQVRRRGLSSVTKSFQSRKTAEIWARQIEQEIERTGVVVDREPLRSTVLRDLCERYEREVSSKKRAGDRDVYFFRNIVRSPLGRLTLDNLRPENVAAYRDLRLKAVGPATVCRELALLRHVLEISRKEWGYPFTSNPVKDIRFPRLPPHRTRRPTSEELGRILDVAKTYPNPLVTPLIVLALETGMRRGELLAARWDGLSTQDATLHLPITKNGFPRLVPLSPVALATISALHQSDDRILPISDNAARLAWGRILKRAGVKDLHFHDLRHEAISRFFELGLSITEVATISGHRDFRMLFRYTHPRASEIARKLAARPH
ncbi:tyrosine-type recombinase/integrase [Ferrovibrio sp.]|jgi:integrase|uniref:integrase n=1 Tax=Ferrovibrio sp. TaxID=1917215 RepID=UPI00262E76DC|nr:tyrosine-type recombinase/integrase [Ferrovibrio sp.]